MALLRSKNIQIKGCVAVLPEGETDNLDIPFLTTEEKLDFVKHTGIRHRRTAKKTDQIIDYFELGLSDLLAGLKWQANEIQVLICVSQTPNIPFPSMSNQLHAKLGLSSECICYDINLGCSGFVYGLQTIGQLLQGMEGFGKKAVLCCGDFSSRIIQQNDSSTEPIFSDGISVSGIEKTTEGMDMDFYLQSIGSGVEAIQYDLKKEAMQLNGIDVFQHSVLHVPKNIKALSTFAQLSLEEIDFFILHQANKLINESIAKKLGISYAHFPTSIETYGNTSSASIPLTLVLQQNETSKQESTYCFSGFGVGFSIGTMITRMPKLIYSNLLER
jgi:3-oxoacyl-[acyl-carrier-protein] synthase-3